MNAKNVTIINPPLWYYQSVPTDIICAASKFKKRGITPIIRDMNMEFLQYVLNREDIQYILNHEEAFYDINKLHEAYDEIDNIYKTLNKIISPNKIELNFFQCENDIRILSNIIKYCDNKINCFYEYFCKAIDTLSVDKIKFVAIALYHPDQLVPMFTLCKMLKNKNHSIHIHIFGNLEDQINTKILFGNINKKTEKSILNYFDSVSFENSYNEMIDLYDAVSNNKLKEQEALLYIHPKEEEPFFELSQEIIKFLPPTHFMPNDVFNVLSSSGCYWGKCSYCSIKEHSKYRKIGFNSQIELFKAVSSDERFKVLRFRDCCISPNDLDRMAQIIIDSEIKMPWCCRARFEKGFNKVLFEKLASAGCIMISFGVETFDAEISKSMNKGIDVNYAYEIIRMCYEAGIAVKLTAIIDYPKENMEQALYNIKKIIDASKYCVDIKLNPFILFNNTKIVKNPDQYNVKIKEIDTEYDFPYFYDYEELTSTKKSIDYDQINEELTKFKQSFHPFISEEHLLLYIVKYGLNACMNYIHCEKMFERIT